jgi:hypothetical protein
LIFRGKSERAAISESQQSTVEPAVASTLDDIKYLNDRVTEVKKAHEVK